MKVVIAAVTVAAILAVPVVSFAQSNQPLTRAQVEAEMVQYEKAGYNPARMNPHTYTDDIEVAQARVAQEDVANCSSVHGAQQVSASR